MTTPTQRAEQLVDAALDRTIDALEVDDLDAAETAMAHAWRAAWLVKQREALALLDIDPEASR